MNKQIVYIPVDQLYPHPDNPRKDLGDLTELTESIKVNGVLQNLTVVPGHRMTDLEWGILSREYQENPTEEVRDKMNSRKCEDGYTVVIGHRRMAAAKLAGLAELPCTATEMTPQEQLKTMMVENMQRSDLTVYEQATGFQLMLDMGETVESIARDSGFSASTIRRRVKLLELDQEKFRKAEARGATLMDYLELDKIEDPERKNAVLDTIGTPNFRNKLQSTIEEEKAMKLLAALETEISKFAAKIEKRGEVAGEKVPMEWVNSFNRWTRSMKMARPDDAGTTKYWYTIDSNGIVIYKEYKAPAKTDADLKREELKAESDRISAELAEITERHFNLRNEFVSGLSKTAVKKHFTEIAEFAVRWIIGDGGYRNDTPTLDVLNLCFDLNLDDDEDYDEIQSAVGPKVAEAPESSILFIIYSMVDHCENGYYDDEWNRAKSTWDYVYEPNDDLDRLYALLVKLGYEISDEEAEMMNGTHALLQPSEDE